MRVNVHVFPVQMSTGLFVHNSLCVYVRASEMQMRDSDCLNVTELS